MYIEPAAFRAPSAESLADTPTPIWTQCLPSPLFAGKKAPLKTFEEVQPLLQQSRKRELKLVIRENSWPINSPVRASLWPALCRQHQHGKSMLDGFYWDMVTQVSDLGCATVCFFPFKVCGFLKEVDFKSGDKESCYLAKPASASYPSRSCLFTLCSGVQMFVRYRAPG
ncbi:Uncharacterized protein OBRU01_09732 [Operophtera brumata]|uniref:Uncharacterized protein n=1 Tax=Operophtera brumata TaxID=104452 RepID=A0A0L7LFF0_OPEBR|nr:Uncharacterized protein OBRU01_09732 [Operophtera brumata]